MHVIMEIEYCGAYRILMLNHFTREVVALLLLLKCVTVFSELGVFVSYCEIDFLRNLVLRERNMLRIGTVSFLLAVL